MPSSLAELLTSHKMKSEKEKFSLFHETYPLCSFAMSISLLYPNKHNTNAKIIVAFLVIFFNSVAIFWFFTYLFKCIILVDIYNITRNMTIGIVVFLFFFKSFYSHFKTDLFCQILEMMNKDFTEANTLDENLQDVYTKYIELGRFGQKCWMFIPILLSSMFPISASGAIIYKVFNGDIDTRVMVHEMDLMFLEHKKYDTPYFEIIFGYNILQCASVAPNFAGFDGFFCINCAHLCAKLELVGAKLDNAFKLSRSNVELLENVKDVIRDHQEALDFHVLMQNAYGGWLFVAFIVTSTVVSFNLYQLALSGGVDPIYLVFAVCAVGHIYTPCYFASHVIQTGQTLCSGIYLVDWEIWQDPKITKMLAFMIARQQKDLTLTGNGVVVFNMELFVSIMQTSYSFFTLIRS